MTKAIFALFIIAATAGSGLTLDERNTAINEAYDSLEIVHDVQEEKRNGLARYLKGTTPEDFRGPTYRTKTQLREQRDDLLNVETYVAEQTEEHSINKIFDQLQDLHTARKFERNQIANVLPGAEVEDLRPEAYLSSSDLDALRAELVVYTRYDEDDIDALSDDELRQIMVDAYTALQQESYL